jgi:hypothetical protein
MKKTGKTRLLILFKMILNKLKKKTTNHYNYFLKKRKKLSFILKNINCIKNKTQIKLLNPENKTRKKMIIFSN